MAETKPPTPSSSDAPEELVVSWKNPDGSVGHGRALPRDSAEEMARIFTRMYPDQTYWLEPAAVRGRGVYPGVQRKRRRPGPRQKG
ncbi:MAG TPA: hypothetical protein VF310_01940 [Vicinamibacteria bacterium]